MNTRIWSLLDVLKQYAHIFGKLMSDIADVETFLMLYRIDPEKIDDQDLADLVSCLESATNLSRELELDSALKLAKRMQGKIGNYKRDALREDVTSLRSRIEDELDSKLFLFVAPSRSHYYTETQLFGVAVNDSFPAAIDDIEGAGKCLALGQGTATVMHLMRVMETGLKALAKLLGIPYAPSWESYLVQIQDKIGAKRKTKAVKWKRDEKFFRDVSGDLMTIKQAWRNPSMHIDRKYSADEAEEIFRSVRSLMQRLATKLPKPS